MTVIIPAITASYAGLLTIIYMLLSINVVRARYRNRISLLDGDNPDMRQHMRIHGNFSEYVPLALILITYIEVAGAAAWLIHLLAGGMLVGRIIHAIGLKATKGSTPGRKYGMYITFAVLMSSAMWILINLSFGL